MKRDDLYLIEVDINDEVRVLIFENRDHLRSILVWGQKVTSEKNHGGFYFRQTEPNRVEYRDISTDEDFEAALTLNTFETAEFEYWFDVYKSAILQPEYWEKKWCRIFATFQINELNTIFPDENIDEKTLGVIQEKITAVQIVRMNG